MATAFTVWIQPGTCVACPAPLFLLLFCVYLYTVLSNKGINAKKKITKRKKVVFWWKFQFVLHKYVVQQSEKEKLNKMSCVQKPLPTKATQEKTHPCGVSTLNKYLNIKYFRVTKKGKTITLNLNNKLLRMMMIYFTMIYNDNDLFQYLPPSCQMHALIGFSSPANQEVTWCRNWMDRSH